MDLVTYFSYAFMFSVSLILLLLSIFNLYRHYVVPRDIYPKLGLIRHLLVVCVILQILVYAGYYVENTWIQQIGWNIWIPMHLFCLSDLGIKVANSYISINKLQLNGSFEFYTKTLGYAFWLLASMINIIGTSVGFTLNKESILQIFWGSWKIVASFALLVVILLLWNVRKKTKECLKTQSFTDLKMKNSVHKILRMILCLICTIIFYLGTTIEHGIFAYQIESNMDDETTLNYSVFSALLHIGMWIFFHAFILAYTWIQKPFKSEKLKLLDHSMECSSFNSHMIS